MKFEDFSHDTKDFDIIWATMDNYNLHRFSEVKNYIPLYFISLTLQILLAVEENVHSELSMFKRLVILPPQEKLC